MNVAQQEATASAVLRHRADGRWVDASTELERWVAACRRQSPQFAAPEMMTAHGATPLKLGVLAKSSAFLARGRPMRPLDSRLSQEEDDEGTSAATEQLRELARSKLRRLIEKEGVVAEQLSFVAQVRKTNARGAVQSRLLVVSDQAVYNVSNDGKKMNRRMQFAAIGHVTASERTGQFILHMPAEYDYLYTATTRGFSPLDDAVASGTPLSGILTAIQRAYAAHAASGLLPPGSSPQLPGRTFKEGGPLNALVKKKSAAVERGSMGSSRDSADFLYLTHDGTRGDDDDDDDD